MKDEWIELFEKYEAGKLSGQALTDFQQRLREDAELKESYQTYQLVITTADYAAYRSLKDELNTRPSDLRPRGILRKMKLWTSAAAIVLILLTALSWYFSTGQVIRRHLHPPKYVASRSASGAHQDLLQRLLAQQDYDDAYKHLIALEEKSTLPNADLYLKGSLALQLKDAQVAIASFRQLIDLGDERFTEKAAYQLAIAYLLADQRQEAIQSLDDIINQPTHAHRPEALKLKKQVEGFFHKISPFN